MTGSDALQIAIKLLIDSGQSEPANIINSMLVKYDRWGPHPKLCVVCREPCRDGYMLKHELWKEINPQIEGLMHFVCAEKSLGRKITGQDLTDFPVNYPLREVLDR